MLPLARKDDLITGVGAHQAEYQGWLTDTHHAIDFIAAAFELLCRTFPNGYIHLRYISPCTPKRALTDFAQNHHNVRIRYHTRPLTRVDTGIIRTAWRKRSNRSKLNRLRRHGELSFQRIRDPEIAKRYLPQIIDLYDFRQGALNDSCPFTDDPQKRPFHLDWIQSCPGQIYVSVTTLNGQAIAAFIGIIGNGYVSNAILAHSPIYARFSPGKLHLYRVVEDLASEGTHDLDLTPGGDPWKDRFATHRDHVLEVEVWARRSNAITAFATDAVLRFAKNILSTLHVPPSTLRSLLRVLDSTVSRLKSQISRNPIPRTETTVVSRKTLTQVPHASIAASMHKDALRDLTQLGQSNRHADRKTFLSVALRRLEGGEHIYTMVKGHKLVLYCWVFPNASHFPPPAHGIGSPLRLDSAPLLYGVHIEWAAMKKALVEFAFNYILRDLYAAHGESPVYVYHASPRDRLAGVLAELGFQRMLLITARKWLFFHRHRVSFASMSTTHLE